VTENRKFPIRFGVLRPLLSALGLGPGLSGVELDDTEMTVRMGWAFQAHIPRQSITGAGRITGTVGGIGVHGWRGRWLVNGSMSGLVAIDIKPAARANVLGVPVRLHYLAVSLDDPEAFLASVAD